MRSETEVEMLKLLEEIKETLKKLLDIAEKEQ